jgi:3-oxoacyl-[acyl-carrier-protein] synthase-3
MTRGFAFDVQAVCAGFVYALANANALIVSGQARVMVIGAETFSRIMDWTDRAPACFSATARARWCSKRRRARHLRRSRHPVDRPAFRRALPRYPVCRWRRLDPVHRHLRMQGKEVFRHAVEKLAATAHTALDKAGLTATMSTGSCRIRPICGSSRPPRRRWACRWTASW